MHHFLIYYFLNPHTPAKAHRSRFGENQGVAYIYVLKPGTRANRWQKSGKAAGGKGGKKGGKAAGGTGQAEPATAGGDGDSGPDPATDLAAFKAWRSNPIGQKVAKARAFIQASGKKMDGTSLKELFSQEQMKNLWQIFEGQRKREGKNAVEKWASLKTKNKGTRSGVSAMKTKCLEVALLGSDKDGTWGDIVATFSPEFADEKKVLQTCGSTRGSWKNTWEKRSQSVHSLRQV